MKRLFAFLLIVISSISYAQVKYYNQAVNSCTEANTEEMIDKCIKDSYLLNYDFPTVEGSVLSTKEVTKSIVILAAASWSAPCYGQIPALNKMVEKYHKRVTFIMIFWDKKDKIKRFQEKLDDRIILVPSSEADKVKKGYLDISGFVHKLDYPTAYLIGKNKQFLNVMRGAATPTKTMTWDQVNEENTKEFEQFLGPIIN